MNTGLAARLRHLISVPLIPSLSPRTATSTWTASTDISSSTSIVTTSSANQAMATSSSTSSTAHLNSSTSATAPRATDRDTQTLRLPDSRTLSYAEYGSPTGYPLFYLHGFPSSRLEGSILHKAALKRNIRVLAPDRPGFGQSTYDPSYTIMGFVKDVRELAKQLGIGRFAVLGLSGGGPYALAFAKEMSKEEGLSAVGVACGSPYWVEGGFGDMPWWSRIGYWLARYTPPLGVVLVEGMVVVARWVSEMGWAKRAMEQALEKERQKEREQGKRGEEEELTIEQAREEVMRMSFEGFRQGARPAVRECWLFTSDWDFRLKDVGYDKVILWHGSRDVNAPFSAAQYIVKALPHGELREYDGNHAEIVTQIDDILDTLVPEQERSLL